LLAGIFCGGTIAFGCAVRSALPRNSSLFHSLPLFFVFFFFFCCSSGKRWRLFLFISNQFSCPSTLAPCARLESGSLQVFTEHKTSTFFYFFGLNCLFHRGV
jgi:hypothetical protein